MNFMLREEQRRTRKLSGEVTPAMIAEMEEDLVVENMDNINNIMQQTEMKKWSELSVWEKISIFNYWTILFLLTDLFLITGSLIYLIIRRESTQSADVWIGFGTFCAWLSLPSFVHQTAQYSLITRTIAFTAPVVGRGLIGIVPVFLAFVFLGMCLFWDSNRYHNVNYGLFTCFAAMNGDSLYDIFYDISSFRFLAALVYFILFTFCSIS